ncbi:TetR/AcrR family transcriptional regulator [Nocardia farcinica]|uniref:TetR/AcrR family transcriptional regulator n=1 Tax=Nocardia TaxID=1817 RepID=UPI000BF1FDCC|nr:MULTISPECIES: TetR/AcrR family transcriptional regulator [Nocardia]MBF6139044.1 TetR/AcrR family transcriptional regulator [Nocardia farcinica]MBF6383559.1 TetR/AcrR family transcriptional regulator [Nocardia farcinica]MBF6417774.1 TetR/AcrR family transcriptional regulator [Nocardia farcinica]MBF6429251.1 TetR/AcrR family transcriptional regulator [Nocardia farcinica]MBF6499835.1 TetR/AcrR family transcriptional regulator [Nocardia farcinica]
MDTAHERAVLERPAGNRRGRRSRAEILDAASRLMAERGYAATSISVLSAATGLPKSAIYHHFHSKSGLLSAVMAHGAYEFFRAMEQAQAAPPEGGTVRERLGWFLRRTEEVFVTKADFLRLHLMLLMSTEAADAEVGAMIDQVRHDGRRHFHRMIAQAFLIEGADIAQVVADELDHFGMAGFDGAFIAWQADRSHGLTDRLEQLADALTVMGQRIVAERRGRS